MREREIQRIGYFSESALVADATAAKSHYGSNPGGTTGERGSYKIGDVATGGALDERATLNKLRKRFVLGQAHQQVAPYPGQ